MPYKPIIFVSYAHADEPEKPAEGEVKWLSFVTSFLRPVVKQGAVEFWINSLMRGGADWEREIERRLRACDIFVLLVSRYSLSSDYVVKKEIPIIRERQASGEDIHFYPLLLTPTPGKALDVVRAWNLRPYEGKPLSHYPTNERSALMSDAADEIAEIAEEIAARKRMTPPASSSPPELEGATIAHDNAFKNSFRGQSSKSVSAIAAREAPAFGAPVKVFISYRREDSVFVAGRIYDRMVSQLGPEHVFFDVEPEFRPGYGFENFLSEKVSACNALITIIGKGWLAAHDRQSRRCLDELDDFMRIEIETALNRGIWVIPVLVDGAVMPRQEDLPEALKSLAHRQGLVFSQVCFDSDFERLVTALRQVAEVQSVPIRLTQTPATCRVRPFAGI